MLLQFVEFVGLSNRR